ncbi:hypothetical protein E2C01_017014 [Portunus trituberculatus]|uniref:Uncharacterized protein n=1 Tax=Portunus trituberculatus TaxID=210409 RepID=A0A5B7DSN9_PORTR|nr:hypothetical protein [Portunus trituberculatus]
MRDTQPGMRYTMHHACRPVVTLWAPAQQQQDQHGRVEGVAPRDPRAGAEGGEAAAARGAWTGAFTTTTTTTTCRPRHARQAFPRRPPPPPPSHNTPPPPHLATSSLTTCPLFPCSAYSLIARNITQLHDRFFHHFMFYYHYYYYYHLLPLLMLYCFLKS